MTKRFSFELKITGILLVVLTLVALTGIFAYQRFTGIVNEISENLRPDMRLLTAKALINDINDAEISVKSFRITEDTLYLTDFYESVQLADEKLFDLHEMSKNKEQSERQLDLDVLDTLISQKVRGLNELLLLRDGFRTQNALDKVVDEIEKSTKDMNGIVSDTISSNKEKRKLFAWLFKKKIKDSIPQLDSTTQLSLENINKEVDEVKKEEFKIEEALKKKELDFIVQDQFITKKIMAFFDEFESAELEEMAEHSEEAEVAIEKTNIQIAWFCAITGVLVILMAFIIINYVRNNNKYRKALKRSKNEAEELARTKQKFLANMSHEIRTPMNAIAGFSEQIGQGPLNDTQRTQLDMVRKSTDHLLYLINEVLDLSKLQANKIKLEKIGFKPENLMNDIAVFLKNEAADKQIETSCHVSDNVPEVLIGDPFRLQQILFNLLSNAVKFTDKGEISILASTIMKTEKECVFRVLVKDTGIGMESKHLKKVFLEFEQAERSTSRNFGGTGLGLSIVKLLVDLHGGNIHLNSQPNEGTEIIFEIPYKVGHIRDLPNEEKFDQVNYSEIQNLKVLIVDDEKYNRLLLISILKKLNMKYTEASDGEAAVNEIKQNDYDLILMDIRMPKLNGIQATKKIRKLTNLDKAQIPIIALTAAVSEQDKLKYFKAGMNGFLAKPYKEKELLSAIKACLQYESKPRIEKLENMDQLELEELKKLAAGDKDFYLEMLQTFVEGTNDGVENMRKCIENEDWENLAEYAHKISSPCKHLGAVELHKKLKRIEKICRDDGDTSVISDIFKEVIDLAQNAIQTVNDEILSNN